MRGRHNYRDEDRDPRGSDYGVRYRDYTQEQAERGRGEERDFLDRANDEVRSWFGDEEAEPVALLGPVTLSVAAQMNVNPMALLAAVTFGSSAAFAMPSGYQTSLMIYGPGGYRFRDFLRMGLPLDLLLALLALWLIPVF